MAINYQYVSLSAQRHRNCASRADVQARAQRQPRAGFANL